MLRIAGGPAPIATAGWFGVTLLGPPKAEVRVGSAKGLMSLRRRRRDVRLGGVGRSVRHPIECSRNAPCDSVICTTTHPEMVSALLFIGILVNIFETHDDKRSSHFWPGLRSSLRKIFEPCRRESGQASSRDLDG